MLVYVMRRLAASVPVLLIATMFTFLLVDLSGDPLQDLYVAIPPVPQETIEQVRQELYLDRPVHERYWLWLTGLGDTRGDIGLLQGKWGPSARGSIDIGAELGQRFIVTVRLVTVATIASLVVAVMTGVVSAVRQYSRLDHLITFIGFLTLALPVFWLAALIRELGVWFNQSVGAPVFATFGATSALHHRMDGWEAFLDVLSHLFLPTVTLVLTGYAVISRFQRAAMLEVLNSDFIRLARAKGLRYRTVIRRHAIRTALIPVVTLAALTVSAALTGAVITESIFRWNGLGTFLIDAVREQDAFSVMAFLVLSGGLVMGANLLADLLYGWLDPRIRNV